FYRIGRIAYLVGVSFWEGTVKDGIKEIYGRDACVPFGQECLIPNMDAPEVSPDIEKEGD
ncbi:MAG: hypothetical protein KAI86_11285, partial [Desulfobacterales bacterium]|nr:hypothetical protein [Desulfobacterales bacterium]